MTKTLIILLFTLLPTLGKAQFHFVTGYQFDFVEFEQTNLILSKYNKVGASVIKPFKNIYYFQGFKGGMRYKIERFFFLLDVNIHKRGVRSKSNNGFGEKKHKITFSNYIYSIGMGFNLERFSLGATFNYNTFRVKSDVHSEGTLKSISVDKNWGNTIFLEYRLTQTNLLEVGLRGFWNINYGGLNTLALDKYLLPVEHSLSSTLKSQNNNMIGLSVLLYNGRQKN